MHAISNSDGCGQMPIAGCVELKKRGYDDHHVVEETWAEYFGFSRSQIDDPSNLVSIPRLKHYQITGWYAQRNQNMAGCLHVNIYRIRIGKSGKKSGGTL